MTAAWQRTMTSNYCYCVNQVMQSDNGNDKHIILHIFGGGLIRSSLEVIEGGLEIYDVLI